MKRIIVVALCMLVLSVQAFATDLVNKDSVKYRVEINPTPIPERKWMLPQVLPIPTN